MRRNLRNWRNWWKLRRLRKLRAEADTLAIERMHLESTLSSFSNLQGAITGVAEAVTLLQRVRKDGTPEQIAQMEAVRADADAMFSMAAVAVTTLRVERSAWDSEQALKATLAQGKHLNRATVVLAVSTGGLFAATVGLIWATIAA